MINMEKETDLLPEKILDRAVNRFGPSGLGMTVVDKDECCARFEGGGGFVYINTAELETGTKITIEGREWDYHIRNFLRDI